VNMRELNHLMGIPGSRVRVNHENRRLNSECLGKSPEWPPV
jgi:hypothetical protein